MNFSEKIFPFKFKEHMAPTIVSQDVNVLKKFLSKKNKVDFVYISNNVLKKKGNLSFFNKIVVFQISFISRIFNVIVCILKLQPMQKGFVFSKKMCDFISENKSETYLFVSSKPCPCTAR